MRHNILAVDDEPHMLTLLERIVSEKTRFSIKTTSNSLEVPRLLDEGRFDLVISDLKMPGMNGIDVLRYVNEHRRGEVVVLITAFGSPESAAEALAHGVFDYIVKPFKKEQIVSTVERGMSWARINRDATRLEELSSMRPFDAAAEAFRNEYVGRLAREMDNDAGLIAQSTGLPVETITEILRDADAGEAR